MKKKIPFLAHPTFAQQEADPLEEKTISLLEEDDKGFLKFKREAVRLPDGRDSTRLFLEHVGAAGMLAIDDEECVVLERQWRHPLKRAFWEIPAGKKDPNEPAILTAKRELMEECGIEAQTWTSLGIINNAIGYSNEELEIFLAKALTFHEAQLDEGEFLEVYRVPYEEALAMTRDGRITDVKTIIALNWYRQR